MTSTQNQAPKNQNVTTTNFAISGYVNTEVEVKSSGNGKPYVQILLGRGKDAKGQNQTSYNLVAFGQTARLIGAELSKGDLIRVTKVGLMPAKSESMDKYNIAQTFSLVIEDFVKIERQGNNNQQSAPQQSAPQQSQNSAPQQQPQPAPDFDSFDDDIPF